MRIVIRAALICWLGLSVMGCGEKRSASQTASARAALDALNRVAAAADINTGYSKYADVLLAMKPRVEQASRILPDDELSKEIGLAMKAYFDAGLAWEAMEARTFQEWYILVDRYSIPSDTGSSLNKQEVLKTIWTAARKHLDRASTLVS